jgi:polyhydroxyalkanoate synthesis regulator phasin
MAPAKEGTPPESRAEQSVEAFRAALEKSVTISRERLQEVVDDAVRRGRMTRGDAEELVNRLVTRSREQADDILGQLEALVKQLGEEVSERAKRARGRAR